MRLPTKVKIFFFAVVLVHSFVASACSQPCISVDSPLEDGESITFFAFCYHTNRFKQELRVSPVFRVTYNFDKEVGITHREIAIRMSQDFEFYVRGLRMDGTHTSYPLATSTQSHHIMICLNPEAVVARRLEKIEEFEAWEKPIIEEDSYQFNYHFGPYYKGATKVMAVGM